MTGRALMDELERRHGKFGLVVAVTSRAREVRAGFEGLRKLGRGAAINRAIGEIARGEVRIRVRGGAEGGDGA